jgi:PKD repeat protein
VPTQNVYNMNKAILILLLLISPISLLYSQTQSNHFGCANDEMHQVLFDQRPDLHYKIKESTQRLEEHTKEYISNNKSSASVRNGVMIIPVVFHVIHNYGPENISDAQIKSTIDVLNMFYRKQNADTIDIVDDFKSLAADSEIEFRLAQKDPDGNCTSGITRTVSSLTTIGDHQVKSLIHWPPHMYLNIYIVRNAAGLAGHALLPGAADTVPEWDGIVQGHNYIGNQGTSSPFNSIVIAHEVGHYLNLQHIWGGNNVPNFYYLPVAQANNCDFDDGVDDTPLTIGWQSCNPQNSPSSCGSLDNVQNFMDYAWCPRMFTYGQKDRMRAALNSPIAKRNNLWQPANLAATGVEGYDQFCEAKFSMSGNIICQGGSITFTDGSYHNASVWSWDFQGGTPSSSNNPIETVTFSAPGEYEITLVSGNGTVSDTVKKKVHVLTLPGVLMPVLESFEDAVSIPNGMWMKSQPEGVAGWELTSQAAYTGVKSIKLDNSGASTANGVVEFLSSTIDLSALSSVHLSFRYATARKSSDNTDKMSLFVSNNCGNSWVLRWTTSNANIPTVTTFNDDFIPTSEADWKQITHTTLPAQFRTSNFRFKFVYEHGGGSNIFIDDINIFDPASVSVKELMNYDFGLKAFPNPVNNLFTVEFYTPMKQTITINVRDLTGRIIWNKKKTHEAGENFLLINSEEFSKGIYLIEFIADEKKSVIKIIK